MIIHWEEFKAGPTQPRSDRLHVTLNRRNVILLNGNIHEKLGSPEAVTLLFDKVNSIIGINPSNPNVTNAFPVKQKGRGRHRLIRATPFCKFHSIMVDGTTAFLNPEIDENTVLRLDLKATTPATRRGRRNQKRRQ
ncbi:MAG: hypothetical protein IPL32_16465 [Chloracidobacterium sp.]|nr:hypothetical protein [Chloracidobacterium sp.]